MRFCIEIVVWNKGYFRFVDFMCRGYISASQTIFLPHQKFLSDIYVMEEYENEKKKDQFSLFDRIRKALWDC